MLAEGRNVVITHELFSRQNLTPKVYQDIAEFGYTLILDEALTVIQQVKPLGSGEIKMLIEHGWLAVDETGGIKWTGGDVEQQRFKDVKAQAQSRTLACHDEKLLLWLFPVKLLEAFEDVYVLTFMFSVSHMRCYLDAFQVDYEMGHQGDVWKKVLASGRIEKRYWANLIDVYDGKLNDVGNEDTALSKTWHEKKHNSKKVKAVMLNTKNFFRHKCGATSDTAMWTTFKSVQNRVKVTSYAGGFCPCNARATNEYRERKYLAYLINSYEHPFIKIWFSDHGISINQDALALSQLLQWMWRSAIRDGEPIRIYIPSKRMRELLIRWLEK